MSQLNYAKYLVALEEIMAEAGKKLVPHFGNVSHTNKSKDMWDVVTDLDVKTESFLDAQLEKLDPAIGFRGEEHGQTRQGEKFWLVDPIDGTGHFIRGMPFCTIMVALVNAAEIEIGAIYNFIGNQFYSAAKSNGAYCNGKPISVSSRDLHNGLIHAEINIEKNNNLQIYQQLNQRSNIMDTFNCGWQFAMIASGKMEARIAKDGWGKDQDYAGGTLLVQEAGGVVANIGQKNYQYTNLDLIACNKVIYQELTEGRAAIFPIH